MKSLTVTTQNAINYGAVLQSYALNKTLLSFNVEDELLNLKRGSVPYYVKCSLKNFPSAIYNNLIRFIRKKDIKLKEKRFFEFVNNNIKTTKEYKTIQEVVDNPPDADVYITGGDQMFNESSVNRATNLLMFGREDIKRISYSTSMGSYWIDGSDKKDKFISALKKYSNISLREAQCKEPLEKLLEKSVSVNIDPTLLASESIWQQFIKPNKNKDYVLCYSLLNNSKLNKLVEKIKQKTKLPVYVISPNARCYVKGADKIIYNAGPIEFLNLIYHAKEVISTSFHGVCFSVIFEKPFYCLTKNGGDYRFENLLNILGLLDRIVNDKIDNLVDCKIDYSRVKKLIIKERQKAKNYLKGALGINE